MDTKEMIEKAKQIGKYGLVNNMLLTEIRASGENYFDSPYWQEHEKIVKEAIKNEPDRKIRKALEGLVL